MRVAVYTDFTYRQTARGLTAELPFALFLEEVAQSVDELVLVGRLDQSTAPLPFALGAGVEFAGLPYYGSLGRPGKVLRTARATAKAFAEATRGVDVVWLFGPHPFLLVFAAIAARRGQTIVLGVRQDLPKLIRSRRAGSPGLIAGARILEQVNRLLARRFPTVVVGPELARAYAESPSLLDLRVSLVRDTDIVASEGQDRPINAARREVISVGRLDPEKNPLALAEILAALVALDPSYHLTVVGKGTMFAQLEDRLRTLQLSSHATLAGFIPVDQGLRELYQASDALLHVSWTEGVPQVLYEAFAAGIPVVATDVGGVREAVGDAALLVPPGAPAQSAAAIHRVLTDSRLRQRLVERGTETVREVALEGQVTKLAEFLRTVSTGS